MSDSNRHPADLVLPIHHIIVVLVKSPGTQQWIGSSTTYGSHLANMCVEILSYMGKEKFDSIWRSNKIRDGMNPDVDCQWQNVIYDR